MSVHSSMTEQKMKIPYCEHSSKYIYQTYELSHTVVEITKKAVKLEAREKYVISPNIKKGSKTLKEAATIKIAR